MKKIAFIIASMLAVAAISSCEKAAADSNKEQPQGDSKKTSTKVEIKLTANLNADYFRYADFQVKYPEGGSVKTENLTAPAADSRSNWTKTLTFTSEADVVFELVCTPKEVEYETEIKTVSGKDIEYVVFNTNATVKVDIMDYDAAGNALYKESYGSTLKNVNNMDSNQQVVETHGFGAKELNYVGLAIKIAGEEKTNFKDRQFKSYRCHYKIVKKSGGLTAEYVED